MKKLIPIKRFLTLLLGVSLFYTYLVSCAWQTSLQDRFIKTWVPKNSQYQKIFNKTFAIKMRVIDPELILPFLGRELHGTGWILDYKLPVEEKPDMLTFYIATNLHVADGLKIATNNDSDIKLSEFAIGRAIKKEEEIKETKFTAIWNTSTGDKYKPKIIYEAINYYKNEKKINEIYNQLGWYGFIHVEKKEEGKGKEERKIIKADGYQKDFAVIEINIPKYLQKNDNIKALFFDYINSSQKTTLDDFYVWKKIEYDSNEKAYIAGYPYYNSIRKIRWTANALNEFSDITNEKNFTGKNFFTYKGIENNNNLSSKCVIRSALSGIPIFKELTFLHDQLLEYNKKYYFKSGMSFEVEESCLYPGSSGSMVTNSDNKILGIYWGAWNSEDKRQQRRYKIFECGICDVLRFELPNEISIKLKKIISIPLDIHFDIFITLYNYDLIKSNENSYAYQDYITQNNIKTFLFPKG